MNADPHRSSRSRRPPWATAATSSTTARSRSWSTRSATSTACSTCSTSTASGSPTSSRPTSTTTTSPAGSRWPGAPVRQYHVNADDEVSFDRTPSRTGRSSRSVSGCGSPPWRPRATPSPTSPTRLDATGRRRATTVGVFSGGSLLYGATGRPDLLGARAHRRLVRHQHASAHRLADLLPDEAGVFPTHGFGSFCSATQSDATVSTIGQEKRANPVLTQDEETYVDELLGRPRRLARLLRAHGSGQRRRALRARPQPARASPTPAELRRRIEAGEWVVDLRNRTAFAAGHAPGTLNFGLDGGFATYLGWLIAWGTPVTLLGETAEDVAEAQRELVRIGIDRPAAHATGRPEDWTDGELPARSRPPPSPTSPRSATTATWSSSTCAAPTSTTRRASPAPSTSPCTSCWDRARRGPRRRGLGALRRRLPRLGRRLDPRRRRPHARGHRRLASTTPRRSGCTWWGPRRVTLAPRRSSPARSSGSAWARSAAAAPSSRSRCWSTRWARARAGHHRFAGRRRPDLADRRRRGVPRRATCCSPAASPSASSRSAARSAEPVPRPARARAGAAGGVRRADARGRRPAWPSASGARRRAADTRRRPTPPDRRCSTTRSSPSARPSPASARAR